MLIRFVLVNGKPYWRPFRGLCLLGITSLADDYDDYIYGIQVKVKEVRSNDLSRVDAARLTMWRCTEPATFDDKDDEKLKLQVKQVFLEKKVKVLSASARIAELQPEILEEEIFFVEVTSNNWPGAEEPEHDHVANGGVIEQFKACGYKVVRDVLEMDRGTWEPLFNPPLARHMLTVYRQGDPNKTELIAKTSRMRSNEPDILKYLHSIHPPSPHVISLIKTIPSTVTGREWLVLPKLHTISNAWLVNSHGLCGREQLGWGLVKGLAYLHEHNIAHRDIKPDNLVCDDDFRLKIIDFDIAMEVQDENTEIADYCGTEGWTAPEVGERDGPPPPMYSPIKADRWSCGHVVLRHIMAGDEDNCLSKFAHQLMANHPQQRPSLPEWHKFLGAPFSDVSHIPKNGMVEVDRESIKLPDSKRPRLE